jgi:hypothetical protein
MFNLDTLDKLIAVVVVLLVLSLIVQSVQAAIKKFFRIKSLQIEQSLVQLFYYVLEKDSLKSLRSISDRMPLLRSLAKLPLIRRFFSPKVLMPAQRDPQVAALYEAVSTEFLRAGRVSPRGKLLIESVSKDELIKFIGQVRIEDLLKHIPNYDPKNFSEIEKKLIEARAAIKEFSTKYRGALQNTSLAEIRQPLLQLMATADQFLDLNKNDLTLGDLASFGIAEARKLIEALPDSIEETIAQLKENSQNEAAEALQKLQAILVPLADELKALAELPRKLGQLQNKAEEWYDTVMQSFEERYVRSMKTSALIISFIVVFLLNANIFNIYREISANEAKRNLIVQSSEQITRALGQQQTSSSQQVAQTLDQWAKESYAKIEQDISLYTAFGFEGPQWILEIPQRIGKAGARGVIETIFGWAVMTMLLSVGAPFWQDALEALFGLKNLLRKKERTGEPPEA